MSLINKVLTDLDQRGAVNGSPGPDTEESKLYDLPFSQVPQQNSNKTSYLIVSSIIVAVLVISGVSGFYLLGQFKNEDIISNVQVVQELVNAGKTAPAQTDYRATNVPAKTQNVQKTKINPKPVDTKKQVVEVRRPQPKVVTKSAANASNSKPVKIPKKKPQKATTVVARPEKDSNFSKSTVPMRSEQRAEVAYQSAYEYLKVSKTQKAERFLRQALAVEPGHVKARELLSGVYIKQGRWVEASELLRHGLSLSPGHRTFRKLYARALMQLNQDKLAVSVLRQHAPPIKSDPEYYAILAALYQRQKDHTSAAIIYQKIVEAQPQNGVWWVGLGISLEALGEAQQASQAYSQALKSGNLHNDIARFTNNRLVVLDEIGYPN